jgi:hypothetical protein
LISDTLRALYTTSKTLRISLAAMAFASTAAAQNPVAVTWLGFLENGGASFVNAISADGRIIARLTTHAAAPKSPSDGVAAA